MVEVKFSNLNSAQLHILADAVGEMENLGNPEMVAPKTVDSQPQPQPKAEAKQPEKVAPKVEAPKKEEPKTDAPKEQPEKEAPKTITKAEARELVNSKITKAIDTPSASQIRGENNKAIKEKLAEYDVKGISDLTGEQIQDFKDFVNTLQDVK